MGHATESKSKRTSRSTTGSCYLPSGRFSDVFTSYSFAHQTFASDQFFQLHTGSKSDARRKACFNPDERLDSRHSMPSQETTRSPVSSTGDCNFRTTHWSIVLAAGNA